MHHEPLEQGSGDRDEHGGEEFGHVVTSWLGFWATMAARHERMRSSGCTHGVEPVTTRVARAEATVWRSGHRGLGSFASLSARPGLLPWVVEPVRLRAGPDIEKGGTMTGKTRVSDGSKPPRTRHDDTGEREATREISERSTEKVAEAEHGGRAAEHQTAWHVNLPLMSVELRAPRLPHVPVPRVHVPTRQELDTAARNTRSKMPPRSALVFCGGLAATAALGVIEWPVAVAVGVGTVLATRRGGSAGDERGSTGPSEHEQAHSPKAGPAESGTS